MPVRRLTPLDDARWDAYVDAHPHAHQYHRSAWKRIIESAFHHDTYYLFSESSSGVVNGVLPLARLRSRMFGDFLVSVPYVNYGGCCADNEAIEEELLREGVRVANELGVDHLEVRTETPRDMGLQVRSAKASMRLPLSGSSERLWERFPAKLRSQIKRAQKEGMDVRVGREEELEAFYRVFSVNMRDLGTPVYGLDFFGTVLRELPNSSWVVTVNFGSEPVAASILLGFRDRIEIPWASSLRQYNKLSPNMLLYWHSLKFAADSGYELFDFGRSTPDSGPYRFKAQWGASPIPLHWHYWVRGNSSPPELNPNNPKYRLAIKVWQHLPVSLTRLIGPSIVKNLP
jgi:serine/alanine adding enzyme